MPIPDNTGISMDPFPRHFPFPLWGGIALHQPSERGPWWGDLEKGRDQQRSQHVCDLDWICMTFLHARQTLPLRRANPLEALAKNDLWYHGGLPFPGQIMSKIDRDGGKVNSWEGKPNLHLSHQQSHDVCRFLTLTADWGSSDTRRGWWQCT